MPRGGKRPGAGAPKGNLNGLKLGLHSKRLRALAAGIALDPNLLRYLLDMKRRQDRSRKKAERIAFRALQELALGIDGSDNPLRPFAAQLLPHRLQDKNAEIQSVLKETNQTRTAQESLGPSIPEDWDSGQPSATITPMQTNAQSKTKAAAVIVAAGQSSRMAGRDKIFAPLLGKPLLAHTLDAFHAALQIEAIVLVLGQDNMGRGETLVREYRFTKVIAICLGGAQRQDSVWAGLQRTPVLPFAVIHDGARPCVTPSLIDRGIEDAVLFGSAVAAVPVKDTIKVADASGIVLSTPDRGTLWAVQTPQVFPRKALMDAYRRFMDAPVTDDASIMERAGHRVHLYLGDYTNIKVTTPEDMAVAEVLLQEVRQSNEP